MDEPTSLWRIKDKNNYYHCDFRLTSYDCAESTFFTQMYITNAIISFIVLLIGIPLLYYRLFYLGQNLYDINHFSRFIKIRPKPIESMLFFGLIFNFLRMFHSLVIAADIFPNVIFRSFLFEFPWAFGYSAFSSYVFGIVQTMNDSYHISQNTWCHHPFRINTLCITLIILPFITNNIVSITAGVYEQHQNTEMAIYYTCMLYYLWTAYCGILAIALIICGTRLIRLLQQNLRLQQGEPSNISKIKAGVLKVKLITFVGTVCLSLFVILVLIYAIFRTEVIDYIGIYYFMTISWTFDGTITSMIVVLSLIINPYTSGVIGNLTGFNSTFTTTMCGDHTQESTFNWNNLDKKRKSLCSMNMDLMTIQSINNNNNQFIHTTNMIKHCNSSSNNNNSSNITAPSQRKLRSSTSISSSSVSLDALPPLFTNNNDELNPFSISLTKNLTTTTTNTNINPIDTINQDNIIILNQQQQQQQQQQQRQNSMENSTYFHFTTY